MIEISVIYCNVYDKPALKNSVTYKCITINKCGVYDNPNPKEQCYLQVYWWW
jgi:hypothetical protein